MADIILAIAIKSMSWLRGTVDASTYVSSLCNAPVAPQPHTFTAFERTRHRGDHGDQTLNCRHRTRAGHHLRCWLYQKSVEKAASQPSAFTDPWECASAEG